MRFPLLVLPEVVTQTASCAVSLRRIQAFLDAEEMPAAAATAAPAQPGIVARRLSIAWSPPPSPPLLAGVDLRVAPGQLVCLLGAVGSGKSSLFSALLGELAPRAGDSALSGTVAYCAQTPFIVNASVRANVLFGSAFDSARYQAALDACALGPDLRLLPAGDETEIGEHGVNLSGGQRQRVALARAAYRSADIYLLDDPLSALDAAVGRHVYERLLGPRGLLAASARLLVTHGAQYCADASEVLVLKDGGVVERGRFDDLVERGEQGHISTLLQLSSAPTANAGGGGDGGERAVTSEAEQPAADGAAALTDVEARAEGRVGAGVYRYYIQAAGVRYSALVLLCFLAWSSLLAGTKAYLVAWIAAGGRASAHWTGGYIALGGAAVAVLLVRQATRTLSQLQGGRRMHAALLHGVVRAPLSFFLRTPAGRLLSRFSGDVATVDERLNDDACDFLRHACTLCTVAVMVAAASPALLLAVPPLALAFRHIERRYVASAREVQRLESVSRSPIFSAASEALAGHSTILAYGETPRFVRHMAEALDANIRAYFSFQSANRWLTVRTEGMAACVVSLAAAAALRAGPGLSAGLAGLSITAAIQGCSCASWIVRALAMVETEMISVERMREYAQLPPEQLLQLPRRPPPGWPAGGALELQAVCMRYRRDLPLVLDGLSLSIPAGCKVGIVGRTGAGKSSLLAVLLRLTDAECLSGRVRIDGLDWDSVGLGDLRSGIAVIPQEGTLFKGTLRFNLDPLNGHDDGALRAALALVGLSDRSLAESVGEEGSNWSAGQRQLLCLARAALRRSRLVLADEATSSCDAETDVAMTAAMRRAFAAATVLTVAHRLGTIADSDRLLVVSGGRAAEYDSPAALAARPGGLYRALLEESRRVSPSAEA